MTPLRQTPGTPGALPSEETRTFPPVTAADTIGDMVNVDPKSSRQMLPAGRPSIDQSARDRNVSGASQFPMRTSGPTTQVDPTAYKAKEITQPALISAPIESVPNDLPYPSLAIKESETASSLASATSVPTPNARAATPKGGILNAFRGGSKKEKESRRRSLDPQPRESHGGLDRVQSRMSQDNASRPAGPRSMAKATPSQAYAGRNSMDVPVEGRALL